MCKWKKRLNLPYRVEYECKKGKELIGNVGIMALQDRFDIRDGKPKPKELQLNQFGTAHLNTWSIIRRQYKTTPYPGQTYKTIKRFGKKDDAIRFVKKYVKTH